MTPILHKLIYELSAISGPRIAKIILKQKKKVRRVIIPEFKIYSKTTTIKTLYTSARTNEYTSETIYRLQK